jgi:hypothetical protein
MNDLFNAYVATVIFKWDPREVDIIWLDAHPQGALDGLWGWLFHSARHVKDHHHHDPLLLREASIIPQNHESGFSTAFKAFTEEWWNCPAEYVDVVGFSKLFYRNNQMAIAPDTEVVVVIALREFYLAHPRVKRGKSIRGHTNSNHVKEIGESMQALTLDNQGTAFKLIPANFAGMRLTDQMRLLSKTKVLAGAHGAALSWCLALPKNAIGVVEWGPNQGNHFKLLSAVRKLKYKYINTYSSVKIATSIKTMAHEEELFRGVSEWEGTGGPPAGLH